MRSNTITPQSPKFALGSWVVLLTPSSRPFDEPSDRFVGMVIEITRVTSLATRGAETLVYTVSVVRPAGSYEEVHMYEGQLQEYEEDDEEETK